MNPEEREPMNSHEQTTALEPVGRAGSIGPDGTADSTGSFRDVQAEPSPLALRPADGSPASIALPSGSEGGKGDGKKRGKGWKVAVAAACVAVAAAIAIALGALSPERAGNTVMSPEEERASVLQDATVPALVSAPGRESRKILVDATEVTVERFQECVAAGACSGKEFRSRAVYYVTRGDEVETWEGGCNFARRDLQDRRFHPMNCVTLEGAREYCAWKGKRLPYDFEWREAMEHQEGLDEGAGKGACELFETELDGTVRGKSVKAVTHVVGSHPSNEAPSQEEGGARRMMDVDGNVAEWVNVTDDGWYGGGLKKRQGALMGWVYGESCGDGRVSRDAPAWESSSKVGFRCVQDVE